MGNQLAVGGSEQELHLQDLGEGLAKDRTLGKGRLLKSAQCWTEQGQPVVVKVYLKKDDDSANSLSPYREKLKRLEPKLDISEQPNVLSYYKIEETDKAGYLVRQYCYSTLVDRISTRPFFSENGKRWIMYQLLQSLVQLHKAGILHGDIKAENVVLTGWDWLFITDLAPFKPISIPADDPGRFSYFFDTAERSICLLAPERFSDSSNKTISSTTSENESPSNNSESSTSVSSSSPPGRSTTTSNTTITTANSNNSSTKSNTNSLPTETVVNGRLDRAAEVLDIFSAGCVLAQLFSDGTALFVLPQLLEYRKNQRDHLNTCLNRIHDPKVREVISHMLQLDPSKRLSAHQYLDQYTPSLFPFYFKLLHNLLSKMILKDCDERIETLCSIFDILIKVLAHTETCKSEEDIQKDLIEEFVLKLNILTNTEFEHLLDYQKKKETSEFKSTSKNSTHVVQKRRVSHKDDLFKIVDHSKSRMELDSTEIVAAVLCSSVRNSKSITNRVKGLHLIEKLAFYSNETTLLQRLVPYTCVLLGDSSPLVKSSAIRTLTHVLSQVPSIHASEANLFTDYLLPALKTLSSDTSETVRVTFAEYLPLIAYQSRRFLEMGQIIFSKKKLGKEDSEIMIKGTFDTELNKLQDEFTQIVLQISVDECASVKQALMKNILQLCVFFDRRKTNDFLLPMIITFLNFKDWRLHHALFEQIVGISVFVGPTSLKEFILPCIMQALYDAEEFVIDQALNGLVSLCELGMFKKSTLVQIAKKISPLLHHPNTWIRYDAIAFFAAASKQLGIVDTSCFILDILRPHLDYNILLVSEYSLLESVKAPVDRNLFDRALMASPSVFIQQQQEQQQQKQQQQQQQEATGEKNEKSVNHIVETDENIANSAIFWKTVIGIERDISSEEVEKLNLMRPYIEQMTRASQAARAFDMGIEESSSKPGDIVSVAAIPKTKSLTVDTNTIPMAFIPISSSAIEQQQKEQEQYQQNEWNALFQEKKQDKPRSSSVRYSSSSSDFGSNPFVTAETINRFKPGGHLFSQSNEHKGSINEIAVHESNSWFITGSNDMTVKLWDLKQAEKDITIVSKMTFKLASSETEEKVKTVTIMDCVGSSSVLFGATDNGAIHLMSPEVSDKIYTFSMNEEGKIYQNNGSETAHGSNTCINVIRPISVKSSPLLLCGNRSGKLVGFDVRVGNEALIWKTDQCLQQGAITTIAGDDYWMITGTQRGFITLWDLRFQMPVTTWRIGERSINSIGVHTPSPFAKHLGTQAPSIYIATGSYDISMWSLETQKVVKTFQCADTQDRVSVKPSAKKRHTVAGNRKPPATITNSNPSSTTLASSPNMQDGAPSSESSSTPNLLQNDAISSSNNSSNSNSSSSSSSVNNNTSNNIKNNNANSDDPYAVKELDQISWEQNLETRHRNNFEVRTLFVRSDGNFFSGSSDRKIRFWDIQNPDHCSIVSGLEQSEGCNYTQKIEKTYSITQEQITVESSVQQSNPKKSTFNSPVSTYHYDTVTDVCVAGASTPVLISASRDGMLKMWK